MRATPETNWSTFPVHSKEWGISLVEAEPMKGFQLYRSSGSEADEQNLLSCSRKVRKELGPFKANRLPRGDKAESEFRDSVLKTAI
jgi:hypothetical protein